MASTETVAGLADFFGIPVVVSDALPIPSSPGADARRFIRHGLADWLEWLGEDVGPKPGAPTTALMIGGTLHTTAAIVGEMRTQFASNS